MEPMPLDALFSLLTACISWLIFHCLLFGEPQNTRGIGSIWGASGLVPAPPDTPNAAPRLAHRSACFTFFFLGEAAEGAGSDIIYYIS